jgi:hypothetical protein
MYTSNKTLAGEAGGIAPPFEENISGDMCFECLEVILLIHLP